MIIIIMINNDNNNSYMSNNGSEFTWLLSVAAVPPIIAIMITIAITITIVVVIIVVIDSSDRGVSIDSINDSTKVFMPNI
jgi:hypothetical protein